MCSNQKDIDERTLCKESKAKISMCKPIGLKDPSPFMIGSPHGSQIKCFPCRVLGDFMKGLRRTVQMSYSILIALNSIV